MIRVGVIDCGTNSVRLLIADVDRSAGSLVEVQRRTTITRLGQGVDTTGELAPSALQRTFAVLEEYARDLSRHRVHRTRFVATSAVRDVSNRRGFFDGVVARVGILPEVISGDEEARLAYAGATRELENDPSVQTPIVACDIGGGSTELVTRSAGGVVVASSMNVGSVRLTERYLVDDPPSEAQVSTAVADVNRAIEQSDMPLTDVGTLVGVAGTVTTIAACALGLRTYDRSRVHLARLPATDVLRATDDLLGLPVRERQRLGTMQTGRAEVIGGGAVVLATVLRHLGVAELLVSEHDILDGIAWSIT